MLVSSRPAEGREDEYNDWYSGSHLADVLRVTGFVAAQRFKLSDVSQSVQPTTNYLAVYEIETSDIDATMNDFQSAVRDMKISSALDRKSLSVCTFRAITDRVLSVDM